MNPRARLALVLAVLAGVAGVVFLSSGTDGSRSQPPRDFPRGTATPQLPTCVEEPPAELAMPSWFPRSLPLPPGSYVHQLPEVAPGIDVAQLYMPVSLDDFVKLVLSEWEPAGWKPGVGEREPGEAETTFVGPDDLYGQFRAQSVYCDQGATNLYIAIAKNEPAPQRS